MNHSTTTCNPYLTFNGNCREAMEFYNSVLLGKLELMPFSEAPMDIPEEAQDQIMHSNIMFGDGAAIMASDTMPGSPVTVVGNNFSISIQSTNMDEAKRIFTALSEGGTIIMPFEDTFWESRFGSCKDRFGIQWMVNCPLK